MAAYHIQDIYDTYSDTIADRVQDVYDRYGDHNNPDQALRYGVRPPPQQHLPTPSQEMQATFLTFIPRFFVNLIAFLTSPWTWSTGDFLTAAVLWYTIYVAISIPISIFNRAYLMVLYRQDPTIAAGLHYSKLDYAFDLFLAVLGFSLSIPIRIIRSIYQYTIAALKWIWNTIAVTCWPLHWLLNHIYLQARRAYFAITNSSIYNITMQTYRYYTQPRLLLRIILALVFGYMAVMFIRIPLRPDNNIRVPRSGFLRADDISLADRLHYVRPKDDKAIWEEKHCRCERNRQLCWLSTVEEVRRLLREDSIAEEPIYNMQDDISCPVGTSTPTGSRTPTETISYGPTPLPSRPSWLGNDSSYIDRLERLPCELKESAAIWWRGARGRLPDLFIYLPIFPTKTQGNGTATRALHNGTLTAPFRIPITTPGSKFEPTPPPYSLTSTSHHSRVSTIRTIETTQTIESTTSRSEDVAPTESSDAGSSEPEDLTTSYISTFISSESISASIPESASRSLSSETKRSTKVTGCLLPAGG